jgi:O-antigen ligase
MFKGGWVFVLQRVGLYWLLFSAPLLLGSNRTIFWGLNGVVAAISTSAFCLTEFRKRAVSRYDWQLPLIAASGIAMLSAWMVFQAVPFTPASWHHPIWHVTELPGAISINPSQTWSALSWWSALSVFLVAVRIGTSQRLSLFVLRLMLSTGVLVAVSGLLIEQFDLRTVGIVPKTAYVGWLTGTFINRNTAATFIGINLVIVVVLVSREFLLRSSNRRYPILRLMEDLISINALYVTSGLILFTALLWTGSRGGIIATIIGCVLAASMQYTKRRDRPRRFGPILTISSLTILACGFAVGEFYLRWREPDTSVATRISLYQEGLKAIADRPFLGHGAGTYASVEPLYHIGTTPSEVIWDNVHSTVLEAIICLGIPATLLVLAIITYVLYCLVKGWRSATPEATCTVAALAVTAAVTVHSFFDFSLEVQAVALYVACITGLAMGEMMRLSQSAIEATSSSIGLVQISRAQ